jgi:hypothetical protein
MTSYIPRELIPCAFVWLSIPELPHVAKLSLRLWLNRDSVD